MPVLSHAIIKFERFMMELEGLGEQYPILKPWMDIGVHWAIKYYIRMNDTKAYVIAICKSSNWPITALTTNFAFQSSIPPYASHGSKLSGRISISRGRRRPFCGLWVQSITLTYFSMTSCADAQVPWPDISRCCNYGITCPCPTSFNRSRQLVPNTVQNGTCILQNLAVAFAAGVQCRNQVLEVYLWRGLLYEDWHSAVSGGEILSVEWHCDSVVK